MPFQVTDANGNLVEVEDGQPIPPGCRLHVPLSFADSRERQMLDDLKRRHPPKAAADDDDEESDEADDGDDDDQDDGADDGDDDARRDDNPEVIRADAYYNFRARIDTANTNRRNRVPKAPKPSDPSWISKVPWRAQGRHGNDAAPSDFEQRRAEAYANFKQRIHAAGPGRRAPSSSSPSSPTGDAAGSERRANLERLQRAFQRR
jgi:hypothetical protein